MFYNPRHWTVVNFLKDRFLLFTIFCNSFLYSNITSMVVFKTKTRTSKKWTQTICKKVQRLVLDFVPLQAGKRRVRSKMDRPRGWKWTFVPGPSILTWPAILYLLISCSKVWDNKMNVKLISMMILLKKLKQKLPIYQLWETIHQQIWWNGQKWGKYHLIVDTVGSLHQWFTTA